ncbi:hypothetical protein [Dactylosporangium sp. CA-092794]|uniref:hypothetical protein n=1 Tax=Dactylosporangium sp. CA-092794 TaxID=3239929 RepID=UPI003D8F41AA
MTVRALSPSRYVVAPPIRRGVASTQAINVPNVWSQVGITTRDRDQDSHAQNRLVFRPPMRGPSLQSNCSHNPGSAADVQRLRLHRRQAGPGEQASCGGSTPAGSPSVSRARVVDEDGHVDRRAVEGPVEPDAAVRPEP